MRIQDMLSALLEVLGDMERQEDSESQLRKSLSGLNFEIASLAEEVIVRGQRIDEMAIDREIVENKIKRLTREQQVSETLEDIELAAEQSNKVLQKRLKGLLENLDFYTSQLEINMSRHRERLGELSDKQLRKEELERQIESLQTPSVVTHLLEALETAFEEAMEAVSITLPANQKYLFQTWCRRNGFSAASEMSPSGLAENWKRARISASRFEDKGPSISNGSRLTAEDKWVMEAAFKNSLSW